MNTDPASDADDIVLAYLNAVDAGADPDPADWLARYPQFADQLTPFFAVEQGIGRFRLANTTVDRHDTHPPDTPADDSPETLGLGDRYEWGGVLGRGGMGAVVRVRDKTLDRRVAVKILRRRHRENPHLAERFRDEVRIAAGLQHPGVPPVHDVGTAPDGRPFMVMKLIEGSTLSDLLARRPDPAHDLPRFLKVFEQIAQTIAYAHSRGVLHRDLKPHNVMVGEFGEVQVMDWGLAKLLASREHERPESSNAPVAPGSSAAARTVAGTALGTPAYMAPEQARGEIEQTDSRADVFGLGAILCEILTGRPPFTGANPLAQSRRGDLADAYQRLDRATCDHDLAALARRCLDPDPANRPADGRAVADAITGYLAGVQERLRQTELAGAKAGAERRRRRAVRNLGALAAALLVAGLGAVLAVQTRANANLKQTNDELIAANDRERQRFALAVDAIGLFHGELSQDLILKETQFKPLRTKLLRGAADFYTRLEGQLAGRDDPESLTALAAAYRELGNLHEQLGDFPAMVAAFEKAVAIRRRLAADRDTRLALVSALLGLANAQRRYPTAGIPASEASIGEGLTVVMAVEAEGETYESRSLVGQLLYQRATNTLNRVRPAEAVGVYRQILVIYEPLLATHPNDPILLRRLEDTHIQLGISLPDTLDKRRHLLQALGYAQALLQQDQTDARNHRDVAHCHMALSLSHGSAVIPPEVSLADAEKGRRLAAQLVTDYPAVTEYQRVEAWCLYNAGRHYSRLSQPADARAAFEAARDRFQRLVPTGDVIYLNRLALTRMHLATLDCEAGRLEAALLGSRQAESDMHELIQQAPGENHQAYLALIVRRAGLIHLAADRLPKATAETRRALGILGPVWIKVSHLHDITRVEMAACHAMLAGLAGKPGSGVDAADAQTEADKAMKLLNTNTSDYYPHPRLLTGDPAFDSLRDRPDFQEFLRKGEAIAEKAKKDAAQ